MSRARVGGAGLVVVALVCLGGSTPVVVHAGPTTMLTGPRTGPRPGMRTGVETVLGLGDSVMAGARCGCAGMMAGYAERERRPGAPAIDPIDRGSDGATTGDLLADLRTADLRAEVRRARVVVVIVGANDLLPERARWLRSGCSPSCYSPAVRSMGQGLDRVLSALASDRTARSGPVLVADYWNVFEDGDQTRSTKGDALVEFGRRVTRLANRTICAAATAHRARCVDLYDSELGPSGDPTHLLADDGDHPDAAGVRVIVSRLVDATPVHTFAR